MTRSISSLNEGLGFLPLPHQDLQSQLQRQPQSTVACVMSPVTVEAWLFVLPYHAPCSLQPCSKCAASSSQTVTSVLHLARPDGICGNYTLGFHNGSRERTSLSREKSGHERVVEPLAVGQNLTARDCNARPDKRTGSIEVTVKVPA